MVSHLLVSMLLHLTKACHLPNGARKPSSSGPRPSSKHCINEMKYSGLACVELAPSVPAASRYIPLS